MLQIRTTHGASAPVHELGLRHHRVALCAPRAAAFPLQTLAHPPVPARLAGAEAEAGHHHGVWRAGEADPAHVELRRFGAPLEAPHRGGARALPIAGWRSAGPLGVVRCHLELGPLVERRNLGVEGFVVVVGSRRGEVAAACLRSLRTPGTGRRLPGPGAP